MASDNMAVDVVIDVDAVSVIDMEAGLGSSRMHLLQQERPPSIKQSIKKSLTKSSRKAKYYLSFIFSPIKWFLLKFKLLILIAIYSCFGAWLFQTLEVPNDLAAKEEAYHARIIARDVMILKLRAIHLENKEDRELRWKDAVMAFESDVGLEEPSMDTAWTFWMAFLYAGTLYTTIGYGNIACQTRGGQVATLLYAFVGIPITLVLLNGLGDFLLKITKFSAGFTSDIILFAGVRWGVTPLEEGSEQRKRYIYFCYRLSKAGILPAPSHVSLIIETKQQETVQHDPPVISAIILTLTVMFTSAAIFSYFEGWDLFTSWYFFFISCSTIGLGDVVPSKPEFMIVALGVMFVGLAMVTVCFNVIQEKLELMFMEMLQKIMEDYMRALENSDPNATAGLMKGFQGKAKFLMPLMSKNTGAAAMNRFKHRCAEQGIEPPAVLTNLNRETGMPAFANANKEDFKDFIEQAEEKQAEERRLVEERVQSRMSNPPEVVISTVPVYDVGIQAELGPVFAPKPEEITFGTQTFAAPDRSFGAQYTPPTNNVESQTTEVTNMDEGIQTWPSCADSSVQYDAISFASCSIQYDIPQLTTTSVAGEEPKDVCSTGIQPEVSMFAVSDSSEDETTEGELSDDELTETLEEKLESLALPTIQRLRKSVSEESQDTVISVSPSMSPTSRRRKLEEKKNKKKKNKMKTEGLRFMRHSGDQTSLDMTSTDCQTDYELSVMAVQCQPDTVEQSMQYYMERKGRRSQTKITCIPVEKANLGMPQTERITRKSLRAQASGSQASQLHSASSVEGLAKHPSLQSVSESESPQDLSDADVNLGISNVIEEGGVIDSPRPSEGHSIAEDELTGAEIGDDIFDSEDDILDEEMEMFVLNEMTQTDDLYVLENSETQASAIDLDILRDILCQTELSSFHIGQKAAQKQKQKQGKKKKQKEKTVISGQPKTEELGEAETEPSEEAEQKPPPAKTATAVGPDSEPEGEVDKEAEEEEEEEVDEMEEEITRGLIESAVQTAQTMVYVGEQDEGEAEETPPLEAGVRYLVDTGCNPELEVATVSCQTEALQSSTTISTTPPQTSEMAMQVTIEYTEQEIQAAIDTVDGDTQATVENVEVFVQAVCEQEDQEIQATTTMEDTESQATAMKTDSRVQVEDHLWRDEGTSQVQTVAETTDTATATSIEYAEIATDPILVELTDTGTNPETPELTESATDPITPEVAEIETQTSMMTSNTGIQPLDEFRRPHAVQTAFESKSEQTQIEMATEEVEVQTEINTAIVETQTEMEVSEKKETVQTDATTRTAVAEAVIEYAPSAVDATTPLTSTKAQSDVSMFVVDQLDRSRMEIEHGVRFNVDSGTWMDEKRQKHIGTQRDPMVESAGIQVKPSLITSHTQYVHACASDQYTQTDIMTKNKRSQKVSVRQRAKNTAVETEKPEGEKSIEDTTGTPATPGTPWETATSMLWSDFDPLFEGLAEDVSQASYFTRLTGASDDRGLLLEVERGLGHYEEAIGPDGVKTMVATKYDAGCSAGPLIDEIATQTNVEVEEKATGFDDDDEWMKVYVQELDEERRNRMFDIGIQTGVLARVQHMYGGKKDVATTEEGGNVDILKVSLRKTESTEALSKERKEGSEGNLSHASSVRSIAESIDEPVTWPSSSRTSSIRRSTSMKRSSKRKEPRPDTVVSETIRRFEEKARPDRPRTFSDDSDQ